MYKKIFLIVGPSGVGKDTIVNRIIDHYDNFQYSVSVTSRTPRDGEVEGKDYYFVSLSEFKNLIEMGRLIQYTEVHGNWYGTTKGEIDSMLDKNLVPIMIVNVTGFDQIRELYPSTQGIFIDPPSMEELYSRLKGRNTDTEEVIKNRLDAATHEIVRSKNQPYALRVINDDLEECLKEIFSFIDNN